MAKDKSKTIVYVATVVTKDGVPFRFHFRKADERDEFVARAEHVEGLKDAYADTIFYVYEEAETALNVVLNYLSRRDA